MEHAWNHSGFPFLWMFLGSKHNHFNLIFECFLAVLFWKSKSRTLVYRDLCPIISPIICYYWIEAAPPSQVPGNTTPEVVDVPILLPHEILDALWRAGSLQEGFYIKDFLLYLIGVYVCLSPLQKIWRSSLVAMLTGWHLQKKKTWPLSFKNLWLALKIEPALLPFGDTVVGWKNGVTTLAWTMMTFHWTVSRLNKPI